MVERLVLVEAQRRNVLFLVVAGEREVIEEARAGFANGRFAISLVVLGVLLAGASGCRSGPA